MLNKCGNHYCDSLDPQMRLPTDKELKLWLDQADERSRGMVEKGEVSLMICESCGSWTGDGWDQKEQRVIRGWVGSPFLFEVGARLKVILKGKRYGMVGIVARRNRLAKLIWPPPPPENYYWIVFKEGESAEGYEANDLEPCD